MTCHARRTARKWKAVTGAPAYWYLWATADPKSEFPPSKKSLDATAGPDLVRGNCWPCPGAGHGADLPLVFDTGDVHVEDTTAELADTVRTFYKDFADVGDPNAWQGFRLSKGGRAAWEEGATRGGMQFEAGGTRFTPRLRGEQCDFWEARGLPGP